MSKRENERVREDSTLNDWNMAGNLHTIKKHSSLYLILSYLWIVLVLIYTTSLSIIYRAQSLQTHLQQVHIVKSFLRFHSLSTDLICSHSLLPLSNKIQWYSFLLLYEEYSQHWKRIHPLNIENKETFLSIHCFLLSSSTSFWCCCFFSCDLALMNERIKIECHANDHF